MTKAATLRTRILTLDGEGYSTLAIAAEIQIPMARVDAILDSLDPPHDEPRMEPEPQRRPKASGPDRRYTVDLPPTRDICGTLSGYWRHRKMREKPCRPCLDAYNTHQAARKSGDIEIGPNGRPQKPINHGTPAGRQQERRRGIPICAECRAAFNADKARRKRELRERKTA